MNRQALAFLTMFSLILMLSVYYVTLPTDTTSVMTTENGEDLSDSKEDEKQQPPFVPGMLQPGLRQKSCRRKLHQSKRRK